MVPGDRGTRICFMPTSSAKRQACVGPAPPKEINVKSRGSKPRLVIIGRIALVIVAVARRRMASDAASTEQSSRLAMRPTAAKAFSRFNGRFPAANLSGSM